MHVLGVLAAEVVGRRKPGGSTPKSPLRAVTLHNILAKLFISADNLTSMKGRFRAMERGEMSMLLP